METGNEPRDEARPESPGPPPPPGAGPNQPPPSEGIPGWVGAVVFLLLFLVVGYFKAGLDGERKAQQEIHAINEKVMREGWREYGNRLAREQYEREQERSRQTMKDFDEWQTHNGGDVNRFLLERIAKGK